MTVTKIRKDHVCTLCEKDIETSHLFLDKCAATVAADDEAY